MLFASDLHPACPNAVIEALACGLPVLAYDTGALRELVTDGAGEVVPYGGDSWNLDTPDSESLADRAIRIFHDQPAYRRAARQRAEEGLGLETMVKGYLGALGWS
jgi:glycosyltransferase involved in cell wall biosynthesis